VALCVLVGCEADERAYSPLKDSGTEAYTAVPEVIMYTTTSVSSIVGDTVAAGPMMVCINELMPSNALSHVVDGESPDWIELHNPTAETVSLARWRVTDDLEDPYKHVLPDGLTLEPLGYLVLYADGEPDLGLTHLPFSLNNSGETFGLYRPDGTGTAVRFGRIDDDLAAARQTDCCTDCWTYPFAGTPGTTNETGE